MSEKLARIRGSGFGFFVALCLVLIAMSIIGRAQSSNATLNGNVADPNGAVINDAELTLTNQASGFEAKSTTNERGEFTFRNLTPGTYDLKVAKNGFQTHVQGGIILTINSIVKVDVMLKVGGGAETVTVTGDTSLINFENATLQGGISPDTLNNLPIVVGGAPRSSLSLAVLLPGITTGSTGQAFNARINGGLQMGDEAVFDGASMQQGFINQSGHGFASGRLPDVAGYGQRSESGDLQLRAAIWLFDLRPAYCGEQIGGK